MTTQNFSPENVPPEQPNSVWVEDGIIYININQSSDAAAVQELNRKGSVLLKEAGLTRVPCILIYTNSGKNFKLSLTDFTNTSLDTDLENVSTIIILGLDGAALQFTKMANKLVFKDRMVFASSLEQAREIAEPFKNTSTSIMDEDKF